MKESIYNTVNPIGKGSVCFNYWSETFYYSPKPIEGTIIEEYRSSIQNGNNKQKSLLEKGGFIIDNKTYEFGRLIDLVKNVDTQNDSFRLHVNPTLDCNFRCWYCSEL